VLSHARQLIEGLLEPLRLGLPLLGIRDRSDAFPLAFDRQSLDLLPAVAEPRLGEEADRLPVVEGKLLQLDHVVNESLGGIR